MLKRLITEKLEQKLKEYKTIVLLNGARQIGKTYIVRSVGKKMFKNFIEINFAEDKVRERYFSDIGTVSEFYTALGLYAGGKLDKKENTFIFFDEIQEYPQFMTLLKFLKDDDRWTYIASGSQLGISLKQTTSIPIGYVDIVNMYPLNFKEYLFARNCSEEFIDTLHSIFLQNKILDFAIHEKLMRYYREYLMVGGLPACVNEFIETQNIHSVRVIQENIYNLYLEDASRYDFENRLKIKRVYELLPSFLENRKKRIIAKELSATMPRMETFQNEFDYIICSGIGLEAKALSNPVFPLILSSRKNLLKIYLNDTGILSYLLFKNNDIAILKDKLSINLGSLYETAVAQELKSRDKQLYYYDNKKNGEVDFLIDDYYAQSPVAIEVKSGRDYSIHSALDKFVSNPDYNIKKAIVLSNSGEIKSEGKMLYLPVYYSMFI